MTDEIIDISRYLEREAPREAAPGTIALWGVEGERSRFALPLWRIVHLAEAERGIILWWPTGGDGGPRPFVVIDLGADPARLELEGPAVAKCRDTEAPTLQDLGPDGVVVFLGARDGRTWCLVADGGGARKDTLEPHKREDILFLAGECAGLLFLRDFADEAEAVPEE